MLYQPSREGLEPNCRQMFLHCVATFMQEAVLMCFMCFMELFSNGLNILKLKREFGIEDL